MCNLYTTRPNHKKAVVSLFDVTEIEQEALDNLEATDPRHWPLKPAPVVRSRTDGGQGRELALLRWGLVPHWADDPKFGRNTTNARSETVATKPAFRAAYKARRCLVPATGFCEYRDKQWHEFTLPDQPVYAMAGLWETWHKGEEPLETFTILTTEANPLVAAYHDKMRMPVILDPNDWDAWLTATPDRVAPLLRTYPESKMAVAPLTAGAA